MNEQINGISVVIMTVALGAGCYRDPGIGADSDGESSSGMVDDGSDSVSTDVGATPPDSGHSGSTSGGGESGAESSMSSSEAICGDGLVEGAEACDDGNDADDDACLSTCEAASCGDGNIWTGVEACDDGLNDGSYGGCNLDCSLAPFCGDGVVNGSEGCDDSNFDSMDGCLADCTVPASCVEIKAADDGASNGVYVVDPDGAGQGVGAFQVYCNMAHDGGGWQLISTRTGDTGTLFANYTCADVSGNCSGTIRDEQVQATSPDLLFATNDGAYWIRLTGLAPPGSNGLMDVITLDRTLTTSDSCSGSHYCGANLEPLSVVSSSENYTPRYASLPSQFARYGGLWLGNGGGSADDHVLALNYYHEPCGSGGLYLSDNSDLTEGNVVCGVPGSIYFRY